MCWENQECYGSGTWASAPADVQLLCASSEDYYYYWLLQIFTYACLLLTATNSVSLKGEAVSSGCTPATEWSRSFTLGWLLRPAPMLESPRAVRWVSTLRGRDEGTSDPSALTRTGWLLFVNSGCCTREIDKFEILLTTLYLSIYILRQITFLFSHQQNVFCVLHASTVPFGFQSESDHIFFCEGRCVYLVIRLLSLLPWDVPGWNPKLHLNSRAFIVVSLFLLFYAANTTGRLCPPFHLRFLLLYPIPRGSSLPGGPPWSAS